jgi:prepilin-type N-terminal cleavage/methylation domain-containing protein
MPNKQKGFTLVEIAIVLVIIGLLLGGVLKGQELITQAKIKNLSNDLNGITAAIYAYQDRYKRLPGDDPGQTRWEVPAGTPLTVAASQGDGNNVIAGAYESTTDTDESRKFWLNLRLAGFVAGATDTIANGSTQPLNAAGGIIGIQSGGMGLAGTIVCAGSLPAKIAQALDAQLDDGNAQTGNVRAILDTAPPSAVALPAGTPPTTTAPTANYADNGTNLYVLCKNI